MPSDLPHITVCICTYKRPRQLGYLLHRLGCQETHGEFTYSIVVADNDTSQSAQRVVSDTGRDLPVALAYCVEPTQNIALVRNTCIKHARGQFLAFLDDDEFPVPHWLHDLFQTLGAHNADGVLGPVVPHFEQSPPAWIRRGGFCDRPRHSTGFKIGCQEGRTGNLLLKREILDGMEPVFRPEFGGGGEDRDLFRRLIASGHVFLWCDEAVAYEWVPPIRMTRRFMLRRALLRGKMSLSHRRGVLVLIKSSLAIVAYSLILPALLIVEHALFMKYLVKAFDHGGKVLAALGINPVRETYVVD